VIARPDSRGAISRAVQAPLDSSRRENYPSCRKAFDFRPECQKDRRKKPSSTAARASPRTHRGGDSRNDAADLQALQPALSSRAARNNLPKCARYQYARHAPCVRGHEGVPKDAAGQRMAEQSRKSTQVSFFFAAPLSGPHLHRNRIRAAASRSCTESQR